MNREYIYKDGQAFIVDEEGNIKDLPYYDNLEEVLIHEDLLEQIENNLKKLEQNCNEEKFLKDKKSWHRMIMFPLISAFIIHIFFSFFTQWLYEKPIIIDNLFHFFIIDNMPSLIPCILLSIIFSSTAYQNYKKEINNHNAQLTQIIFLKKEQEKIQEKIRELQQEKTNSKDIDFEINVVDSKKLRENMQYYQNLYSHLGYYEEKYLKCMEKGTLEKELSKSYNEVGVEEGKSYFEENSLILRRKRKK